VILSALYDDSTDAIDTREAMRSSEGLSRRSVVSAPASTSMVDTSSSFIAMAS
jgi:hypothetical protein